MHSSIRHFTRSVETLLTGSAVELPRRTRAGLVFFIVGILLAGSLVLRRIACTHAYLTPQTTCAASHERRLRRVVLDRGVNIPEGLVVGEDPAFDGQWFRRTEDGVTLVTQPMLDKFLSSR